MRVAITSDWHLDAVTLGVSRLPEFDAFFAQLLEERFDLCLVLGDFFDPGTMRSHELTSRLMVYFSKLAAKAPTIVIAGNHDVVERSPVTTVLSPIVTALELVAPYCGIMVVETPEMFRLPGVDVLALPYMASAVKDRGERTLEVIEMLWRERAVGGPFAGLEPQPPLIVMGHFTIPGAVMGSETYDMSRGPDEDFPVDAVANLAPDLVLNGHYHRQQRVNVGALEVVIPGSPLRYTFGESEGPRGYVVAEFG